MKTLRELLVEYNTKKGYGLEEDTLMESLLDDFEVMEVGEHDRHRWYSTFEKVIKLEDNGVERFFKVEDIDVHGECADKYDCGWEDNVDNAWEVFPKEVTTIVYE